MTVRSSHLLLLLAALGVVYKYDAIRRFWYEHSHPGQVPAGIRVYTSDNCPPCADTADFFRSAGIPYTLLNIEQDTGARADFEYFGGRLPLVVEGRRSYPYYDPEFFRSWFVDRSAMRAKLDGIGVYRAGEERLPVLYGTDWCPHCAEARKYFSEHGMRYRDYDIERDAEAARQYDALGLPGVPVIVYEDMVWNGFSADAMDAKRQWVSDGRK